MDFRGPELCISMKMAHLVSVSGWDTLRGKDSAISMVVSQAPVQLPAANPWCMEKEQQLIGTNRCLSIVICLSFQSIVICLSFMGTGTEVQSFLVPVPSTVSGLQMCGRDSSWGFSLVLSIVRVLFMSPILLHFLFHPFSSSSFSN